MTKKKVHYMLQNVQSVTTFPLPPSKIPDFIGTTGTTEKTTGTTEKTTETTENTEKTRKETETTEITVEKRTGAAIDLCNA